ncbi:hypothetical protein IAE22_30655, partial [Bacillus sp. S34]|nr:hypothetical protein [Bacillus sp. S34]
SRQYTVGSTDPTDPTGPSDSQRTDVTAGATVTASAENPADGQTAAKAVDGVVSGYPADRWVQLVRRPETDQERRRRVVARGMPWFVAGCVIALVAWFAEAPAAGGQWVAIIGFWALGCIRMATTPEPSAQVPVRVSPEGRTAPTIRAMTRDRCSVSIVVVSSALRT